MAGDRAGGTFWVSWEQETELSVQPRAWSWGSCPALHCPVPQYVQLAHCARTQAACAGLRASLLRAAILCWGDFAPDGTLAISGDVLG